MPDLHSISLVWPFMLWSLAALPALVALYAWLWVRSSRQAARAAGAWQAAATHAGARGGWWRRHGPAMLVLAGIAVLLVSLTRPRAVLMLPGRVETVMIAIDSSGSMRANDVKPSRIELAQEAARQLVQAQPAHVKLGVVSVAGTAAVVQGPTENRDSLVRAIGNLPLQRGSALGSGLVIALAALLPNAGIDVDRLINPDARAESRGAPLGGAGKSSAVPKVKLEPGSNDAAAIVLMTDGQSNLGPDVLKMAQVAADLGVRVHTIGFGTPEGAVLRTQGVAVRVKLDEEQLKRVAEITHGEYFRAAAPRDMKRVYDALGMRIVMRRHQLTEVTALLLLAGTALALAGSAWSIGRSGRVL